MNLKLLMYSALSTTGQPCLIHTISFSLRSWLLVILTDSLTVRFLTCPSLRLASRPQTSFKGESGEGREAPAAKGQEGAGVPLKPWAPHRWCASRLEERGTAHMSQKRPQSSVLYLKVDFRDSGSL